MITAKKGKKLLALVSAAVISVGAAFSCGGGFTVDAQANIVPLQLPPTVGEGFHANASRNPVSGLVALA